MTDRKIPADEAEYLRERAAERAKDWLRAQFDDEAEDE